MYLKSFLFQFEFAACEVQFLVKSRNVFSKVCDLHNVWILLNLMTMFEMKTLNCIKRPTVKMVANLIKICQTEKKRNNINGRK